MNTYDITLPRYAHIKRVIDMIKPKVIMEIGVLTGRNAEQMIRYAQNYQSFVTYYGFDLFEDLNDIHRKAENIMKNKPRPTYTSISEKLNNIENAKIILIKGDTKVTLPKFKPFTDIDFIFIDGGHSLETIENDWLFCSKLVNKKTIVLFDDYWHDRTTEGCMPLIARLQRDYSWKYAIQVLEPIDSVKHSDMSTYHNQMVQVSLRDGL